MNLDVDIRKHQERVHVIALLRLYANHRIGKRRHRKSMYWHEWLFSSKLEIHRSGAFQSVRNILKGHWGAMIARGQVHAWPQEPVYMTEQEAKDFRFDGSLTANMKEPDRQIVEYYIPEVEIVPEDYAEILKRQGWAVTMGDVLRKSAAEGELSEYELRRLVIERIRREDEGR